MFGITSAAFFGGASLIAFVTMIWSKISLYLSKLYGIFIVRLMLDEQGNNNEAHAAINHYLHNNFKASPISLKTYYGYNHFIRSKKKVQLVAFETLSSEPTIYWKGWKPMFVTLEKGSIHISYIRGLFKADKIFEEAFTNYNLKMKTGNNGDRYFVERIVGMSAKLAKMRGGQGGDVPVSPSSTRRDDNLIIDRPLIFKISDIGQPITKNPTQIMALTSSVKCVVEDAKRWKKSEDWYKSKNIPWKYGIMAYGPPGTGKTTLARSLGQELNMPVWSFDLASLTNQEFIAAWKSGMLHSPFIALLEDIDAVFQKRENISNTEDGLTFDCLLNCIDGVENTDGLFLIITTNNVNAIDPALCSVGEDSRVSRPGRINKIVKMDILDRDGRMHIASRILAETPTYIEPLVDRCENYTGAQFQDLCSRLAPSLYWEQKDKDDDLSIG